MIGALNSYSFTSKLVEGEKGEQFIADYLRRYGEVRLVSQPEYQKVGIDAFMVSKRWGYTSLQFKRCNQAQRFGNAFIEIEILNAKKERTDFGWAYKTTANYILYWCVGMGVIYVIDTMALKRELPKLKEEYPTGDGRSVENGRTWFGRGLRVPLAEVERSFSRAVLNVRKEEQEYFTYRGIGVPA